MEELEEKLTYVYDGRYKGYNYLEEWLMHLPNGEWLYLNMLVNLERELTEKEIHYLAEIALPMYCQEMNLEELTYDLEFMRLIIGYLMTGIIMMSLKIKGFVKSDEPIKLYKDYALEKTEKLEEYFKDMKEGKF